MEVLFTKQIFGQKVQRVKAHATKPKNPSSIPQTHRVEEMQLLQGVISSPHTCCHICAHTRGQEGTYACMHTHSCINEKVVFLMVFLKKEVYELSSALSCIFTVVQGTPLSKIVM